MACDFLPPSTCACILLSKQLFKQQMVQFQNSILNCLHHHTLSNMLFDKISKAHCALILSCFGLGASAWFTIRLIFSSFQLTSPFFFTMLWIWLGLPHLSIASIIWCVCTHPINPMGIHLLHYAHNNKRIRTYDVVSQHLYCHCAGCSLPHGVKTTTCASFKHVQLLSSTSQHCVHQRWHLHLNQHYHCWPNMNGFTFPILCHPRICYFQCGSNQRMELSWLTPW
jgi:hypothetical protein